MLRFLAQALTQLGVFAAHPAAFLVATLYVATWLALDRASFDWHSSVTVATWFMTLFIQRAEHRDTQAIHAKLDALLRTAGAGKEELTHIDEEEPETIVEHRSQERDANK
jgi:low affinity Fe/Cu permease